MYPKSFFNLLMIGFALALLPLMVAFANAFIQVDYLAEKSRNTVSQSVQATRSSRELIEQLTVMERSARQYIVLHDPAFMQKFSVAHEKFKAIITSLKQLPSSGIQHLSLHQITVNEDALAFKIQSVNPDNFDKADLDQFSDLSKIAQSILAENNRLIDSESAALAKTAEKTQRVLFWQALMLLPVAILVALIITYLVAKPIKSIDSAIKGLGAGNYDEAIMIDGPGDIGTLGERLNWLRTQLQSVEQQKQRFLRHVSHELKTPLTAIREGSELLHDEVGGKLSEQQKEISSILRESSIRLQKMIENLLKFTALVHRDHELHLTDIHIEHLLKSVLTDYALSISSKKIHVKNHFEPTIFHGDEDKIRTVFDNLISNAIKFTPFSGTIGIRMQSDSQWLTIDVHDTGMGISEIDKEKLFDAFFRGKNIEDTLVSGSGLGLSIAKEYVEAHDGNIMVMPSKLGAQFRVMLPLNHSFIK